jgi:hypothetical protein
MATYTELNDIANNNTLLDKFTAAVAIQAEAIRNENTGAANHPNRLIWAKSAFSDPRSMAAKMQWAILAQNQSAPKATILAATDATILTAVAAAVDVFATGS